MASRIVVDFSRTFEMIEVTAQADFVLTEGSSLVLFGPSGSGKTTILRAIAGLDLPSRGVIQFDDEVWFDGNRGVRVTPQNRRVGFLSQNYDLFPHLTVLQNVLYGASDVAQAEELLERFRIAHLIGRFPASLSGGEKQRVAVARALARKPRLLLLDEPLSALDTPTREVLRSELRSILHAVAVPSIIVTHDRNEALSLGDTIAVVIDGRIVQTGQVETVFNSPASAEVARATGIETVLPVEIVSSSETLVRARHGEASLEAAPSPAIVGHQRAFALIRAGDVTIDSRRIDGISARNQLPATIRSIEAEDPLVRLHLDCGFPVVALITRQSFDELELAEGSPVFATIKASAIRLVPR